MCPLSGPNGTHLPVITTKRSIRSIFTLLQDTWRAFIRDDASLLGAAMVYYALLSLGPLLLLLLAALSLVVNVVPASIDARAHLLKLASTHLGEQFRATLEPILDSVGRSSATATGIGFLLLFYGATGAFRHLRKSFRRIWRPDHPTALPIQRVVLHEVVDALAAFALVLAAGTMMLLSTIGASLVAAVKAQVLQVPLIGSQLNLLVSPITTFALGFFIFCALYRFLPPSRVRWRDVWLGALLAALLWEALKRLLAFYLTEFAVGSTYGLVGTVLVLTIWVYATCLVVFLGAEFCKVWARRNSKTAEIA
jgi:membrane protein